jgi:tetratricopeptide (TPR) repeat protein
MKRLISLCSTLVVILVPLVGASLIEASPSPDPKKNKKKDTTDPLKSQALLRQGLVFMQQQKYEEAIDRFREADAANPGNATVYNMIGLCHLSLEEFDEALESFDKALATIPGFTDARNNRGTTYLALEQYRLAEVDFIAVLSDSTYPHRWKVFYNLGMTYLQRGQIGAAEENFHKAILAPNPVYEAYLRLSEIAQSQGRIDAALGVLDEARLKYPERLDGLLVYGRLLIEVDRGEEARPYLQDVIDSEPGSPLAAEARELLARL